MRSKFTIITSTRPNTLTKEYRLDGGKTISSTIAHMTEGLAQQGTVTSATEFADVLAGLTHNQALCFGVPPMERARVLSRKAFDVQGRPADAVTRTSDVFKWPRSGGVMMLDYDPQEGMQAFSKKELIEALTEVVPGLSKSAYVWWCSSSSLIYHDQNQLRGVRGQRVYILVKDARDIERAGKALFERLWLAGYGYYMISRAGSALERSIIDASVWQTSRLDFAAGARCVPPLEQRRDEPEAHEGEPLDTAAAIPCLTEEERAQLESIKEARKATIADDIDEAKQQYIRDTVGERVAKLEEKEGRAATDDEVEQITSEVKRALSQSVLAGDYEITLADGAIVTVGEVLDNPTKYHGATTKDPLEPEYDNHKTCGKLYLIGGRPNLYSQAHGGRNFRLIRQPRRIERIKGQTADTTAQTIAYLKHLPDVFDMGSEMVQVVDGGVQRFTHHSLAFWLGGVAQFYQYDNNHEAKNVDPPAQVINQLLAIKRNLKPLKAVITAPVITVAGDVLVRAGYDEKTQLYLDPPTEPPRVPAAVSEAKALEALDRLMQPFAGFAVASTLDRGVMLAGILTAVQRPILPTAPALGIDAPVQGTGKTYLAQCLGALATGEVPPVYPHTAGRDDEETRKRLLSILAEGSRVIVWDNVLGYFDSASIASLLTSETYRDRMLGKTETAELPNRALFIITGNNLALAGDMPRRVLKCRLDAGMDNPALRKFTSNPLEYILQHRQEMVRDALIFIRGYQQSDAAQSGGAVANESTASFEVWDELVRQPVAWAAKLQPDKYTDPAEALKEAVNNDPEKEVLGQIHKSIIHLMGEHLWFTARELCDEMKRVANVSGDPQREEAAETLHEILEGMATSGRVNSHSIGRVLSFRVDRIVDGCRLVKRVGPLNTMQFSVGIVV